MDDLESIYREHADMVFRFLMSRTGSVDLSEELTQETFYQAVKSIDKFDGSSRISTWLCGIAKNVLLAHMRANRRDTEPVEALTGIYVSSAEDTVMMNEQTRSILNAINDYPDPGGEILRMRIFGGLSFKQIGEMLGRTETWARVNYYRAKQITVKELEKNG